jgi:hypothetical protein
MELDITKLQNVADRFSDGRTDPPTQVVQVLAALAGDAEIAHPVAAYDYGGGAAEQIRTKWECMALAGSALVAVSASSAGEWHADSFDDPATPPIIYGSLIPLGEITAVRLTEIRSLSLTAWLARWQLQLRSGDTQPIPWPKHRTGQERHEAFALEIAKRIR